MGYSQEEEMCLSVVVRWLDGAGVGRTEERGNRRLEERESF